MTEQVNHEDPVVVGRTELALIIKMLKHDCDVDGRKSRGEALDYLYESIERLNVWNTLPGVIYQRRHTGVALWTDVTKEEYDTPFLDAFEYRRVMADPTEGKEALRGVKNLAFVIEKIEQLVGYQNVMSYNDSYFGEPAGLLKTTVRDLGKQLRDMTPRQKAVNCFFCDTCLSPREETPCWKCQSEGREVIRDHVEMKMPDVELIRRLAADKGYAIAVHGSLERDLDIVALPWVETACSGRELLYHIQTNMLTINGPARIAAIEEKPVGRLSATIQMDGVYKPIDISIAPMTSENLGDLKAALRVLNDISIEGKPINVGIPMEINAGDIMRAKEILFFNKKD